MNKEFGQDISQKEIKEQIEVLYSYCDAFEKIGIVMEEPLKEILHKDLLHFTLYLAAADGKIENREIEFIKDNLKCDKTADAWIDYIRKKDIYSSTYRQTVPKSLEIFNEVDNKIYLTKNNTASLCVLFISIMEDIGRAMIISDGEIDEQEKKDLSRYLNTLKKYVTDNTCREDIAYEIDEEVFREEKSNVRENHGKNENEFSYFGETIIISKYTPLFVGILHKNQEYTDRLLNIVAKQAKRGDYCGGNTDEDFKLWHDEATSIAREIIKDASKHGIYDLTEAALLDNNTGYIQLRKVCSETINTLGRNLVNAMQGWLDYQEQAELEAKSNITGLDFGLITNSASSFFVYSLLEASAINSQYKKADEEYRLAMSNFTARNNSKLDEENNRTLTTIYYPGCRCAIQIMVSEMMSLYVKKLDEKGVIAFDELEKYDMKESDEILKNLLLVDNKEQVIRDAFFKCPFNPQIYIKLLELNMVDFETFSIAKYLQQEKEILPYIEKKIHLAVDREENANELIRIQADYVGEEYSSLFRIYHEKTKKALEEKIELSLNVLNSGKCKCWVEKNIANKTSTFISMEDSDISKTIRKIIIGIENDFKEMKKNGISIKNEEKVKDDPFFFEEITKKLTTMTIDYRGRIKNNYEKEKEQIAELHKEYLGIKYKYEDMETEVNNEKKFLLEERNKCGFLEFSKKGQLDMKYKELEKHAEETLSRLREDLEKSEKNYNDFIMENEALKDF